jgi:hypothetical protein
MAQEDQDLILEHRQGEIVHSLLVAVLLDEISNVEPVDSVLVSHFFIDILSDESMFFV